MLISLISWLVPGLSSFMPFKSIYQKQLGMSTAQNGLIQAMMQLASLFSPPIAGIITDKTKAYKIMLGTLLFFGVAFTIPFYFVPPSESLSTKEVISCCLAKGDINQITCPGNTTLHNATICSTMPNVTVKFDTVLHQQCLNSTVNCTLPAEDKEVYGSTFAFLVVLTVFMSFFLAPVTPLLDSSAMDTLGREKVSNFGIQRLWGAVGFGVAGLGVGYLTDVISPIEVYGPYAKNYFLAFCSVALFWGIAIFVIVTSIDISAPKAKGILHGLRKLLVKQEIILFLFIVLVSGYSTGVQYSYLFWYLVDFHDFEQLILGLSVLITCLSEIPMFLISGWICKTFGYVSVLSIGLCAVSVSILNDIVASLYHVYLIFAVLDPVLRIHSDYRRMADSCNRMASWDIICITNCCDVFVRNCSGSKRCGGYPYFI